MSRALLAVFLLVPSLAYADVPPDEGGGCRCDVVAPVTPAAVGGALIAVLAVMSARRRR